MTTVGQSKGLDFEFPPAILYVKILGGSDLYKTDTFHKIDPYVEAALGADSSRSITLLRGGSDCIFNWTATFPFDPAKEYDDGLIITVWDQDLGRKDDQVGGCMVPIKSIMNCKGKKDAFIGQVQLMHTGRIMGRQKPAGTVDVEIYWEDHSAFLESTDSLREFLRGNLSSTASLGSSSGVPLPLNYCVTNFNKLSGVAQTLIDKGKLREYKPFRTYRLRLWYVDLVFQRLTKGWNKSYSAAQQIYGPSLSSKAMRAALRVQHFMSYTSEFKTDFQPHEISGMKSLHKMLLSYDTAPRTGQPSSMRYTYVIMPDSQMHFSMTSKKIATDFLSKHALHAGAATEVVYSGEFFFDQYSTRAQETGIPALVIDNNSGTFGPPKDRLNLLQLLMQLNFGTEFPILALDREDPLLKKLSDANGVE